MSLRSMIATMTIEEATSKIFFSLSGSCSVSATKAWFRFSEVVDCAEAVASAK
jgi:hypothetical protein